jgi:hypothetical protein
VPASELAGCRHERTPSRKDYAERG